MATIFIRRRPDSVMDWAVEDVADWLKDLKLDKYCKRFQSHLVTGPVILQMDYVLLDDLNITLGKERQLLLRESRKLCLQELDLVNKAIEFKQKTEDDSFSSKIPLINITYVDNYIHGQVEHVDLQEEFPMKKEMTTESECQNSNTSTGEADKSSLDIKQSCDPDEVATRATLMVTILSQENSDLRIKLEQLSYQNEHQLKDEITHLRVINEKLQSQVQQCKIENRQIVTALNELRRDYQHLSDSFKHRENDINETLESETEKLRQDNRLIRDKYQRFKFRAVEREMSRKVSNGSSFNSKSDSQSRSPRESPRQSKDNSLQLIENVYKANKRCAELEDTVRWLYSALRLENSKSENHRNPATDEADHQAPNEPDWPSLAGKIPILNIQVNKEDTTPDADVLSHIVKNGLPTDSDEDIWTRRVTNKTDSSPKPDVNRQDGLHHWNV